MMSKSVNSEPRNADRLYLVDPTKAGPAVKLRRLRLLASRASARWWVAGFGPGPNAGPVQNILRRFGRENGLGLLPELALSTR